MREEGLKIGIDARVLGTNKALERYTRQLISSLLKVDRKNRYILLTDELKKVEEFASDHYLLPSKKVLTDHLRFGRQIQNLGLDLVLHPDNTEFLNCIDKSIVTLHDVIPWKFPEMILSLNPLLKVRQRLYFRLQEAALKKATHIITVSETSKTDIQKYLGIPEDRITVVMEGVEETFAKKVPISVVKKYGVQGDYVFYIGGFSPHKNVLTLIKAYSLLASSQKLPLLVLGGKRTETKGGQSTSHQINTEIIKNGLQKKVIFTDYISEADLPAFYQHARVFVYPSLYEGFGFPPLEAMKAGTPVVTSQRASLGEIVGDGGAITEVTDPKRLAQTLDEILGDKDLAAKYRQKGYAQVKKFSWEKCALQTQAVFEKIGKRSRLSK